MTKQDIQLAIQYMSALIEDWKRGQLHTPSEIQRKITEEHISFLNKEVEQLQQQLQN